jgi:hypothetical protein
MKPSEEAKKANLDVRRETAPIQAEYINQQQAEAGDNGPLQRENKVLPNEQYPGQYEQGTAAAEDIDRPSNAGNAMPEKESLPQGGKGAPEPLNERNPSEKSGAEKTAERDGAADLQRQAERKEADAKLQSAKNLPSGGNAKSNDGKK